MSPHSSPLVHASLPPPTSKKYPPTKAALVTHTPRRLGISSAALLHPASCGFEFVNSPCPISLPITLPTYLPCHAYLPAPSMWSTTSCPWSHIKTIMQIRTHTVYMPSSCTSCPYLPHCQRPALLQYLPHLLSLLRAIPPAAPPPKNTIGQAGWALAPFS